MASSRIELAIGKFKLHVILSNVTEHRAILGSELPLDPHICVDMLPTCLSPAGSLSTRGYVERGRDHLHITYIKIYCYNGSNLLVIVVHLLPSLTYKWSFIIGISVQAIYCIH